MDVLRSLVGKRARPIQTTCDFNPDNILDLALNIYSTTIVQFILLHLTRFCT